MEPRKDVGILHNELQNLITALNAMKGKKSSPEGMMEVAKVAFLLGTQIKW